MAGPDDDPDRLRQALQAERASSTELRRSLREARAELASLRRRDAVRVALAVDQRLQPRLTNTVTRVLRRARLVVAALPTRRDRGQRRDAFDHARARTEPSAGEGARTPASVSVVVASSTSTVDELHRDITATSGDIVCVRLTTSEPVRPDWDQALAESLLTFDAAAVTPTFVHPERKLTSSTPHDLLLRARGWETALANDGLVLRAAGAGRPVEEREAPASVLAGSVACIAIRRATYDAVGGLAPLADLDAAIVDLCIRLREHGHRVMHDPDVLVIDRRPVTSIAELAQPLATKTRAWSELVDRQGAALRRAAAMSDTSIAPTIAITIGAPSAKVAPRWGDWPFAHALADSLRTRGFVAEVHTADQAETTAARVADVHLVVRGRAPIRRTSGQRHVLWIISHPEEVETQECDDADLVFVASRPFADELATRTSTPVEVLLQATDHRRFHRVPAEASFSHPLAIVARSRGVIRPAVADALEAGLRPALYGTGWADLVDPALVAGDYVDNERLPALYSSIGLLLVDHWQTMRDWGFVSNRVYDALACGAPVIADPVVGIEEIFGDAVATYQRPAELRELVEAVLKDPEAARLRTAAGTRAVLDHHTFDHRADQFEQALARHGLTP